MNLRLQSYSLLSLLLASSAAASPVVPDDDGLRWVQQENVTTTCETEVEALQANQVFQYANITLLINYYDAIGSMRAAHFDSDSGVLTKIISSGDHAKIKGYPEFVEACQRAGYQAVSYDMDYTCTAAGPDGNVSYIDQVKHYTICVGPSCGDDEIPASLKATDAKFAGDFCTGNVDFKSNYSSYGIAEFSGNHSSDAIDGGIIGTANEADEANNEEILDLVTAEDKPEEESTSEPTELVDNQNMTASVGASTISTEAAPQKIAAETFRDFVTGDDTNFDDEYRLHDAIIAAFIPRLNAGVIPERSVSHSEIVDMLQDCSNNDQSNNEDLLSKFKKAIPSIIEKATKRFATDTGRVVEVNDQSFELGENYKSTLRSATVACFTAYETKLPDSSTAAYASYIVAPMDYDSQTLDPLACAHNLYMFIEADAMEMPNEPLYYIPKK
ncbi:unknown protein [Seminavis robusta]|uniref:Uncharacterized protein n=1 Tax=Seminavis robusta TaxID=568900 RepID=A0A9N8HVY8_9STRA|nr:unknown protein [Seminavis robusta]|eukprot:Sro1891_g303750.1 n/a (443) ;mRNA; f:2678-4091